MKKLLFLMIMSLLTIMSSAQINENIVGIWVTDGGESKIEIFEEDEKFFGKIVYIDEDNYVNGQPDHDRKNPDKELRDRSLLGMIMLEDFVYNEKDNELSDGSIYNPETGKTYDAFILMKDENTLKLRGYVAGMRWLGKTTIWKRDVVKVDE